MTDNIHLNIQDTVADRINVSIQEASIHLELGGYVRGSGGSGGVAIEGSGSYMQDTGTVKFSNTPEIRFGLATNGIMTASHNALASSLTTQFVGTGTTLTNASATLNSNGMQLNIPEGKIYFMDADGVSWNSSISALSTSISASVNTVGSGGGGAALKGSGVYTQNTGTIEFANSNDITFGLTDNQMTASFSQSTHEHPYLDSGDSTYYQTSNLSSVFLTTAALSSHSHGDVTLELTNLTGTISSASSGITLSLSADNAAAAQTAISGIGIRADISETSLNTTYTSGTVIWQGNQFISISHSTNGASQYVLLSVDNYLTTAMASNAESNFAGLGETTATTAGSDLKMTVDSQGVNIAFPKWITTYAGGDAGAGLNSAITGGSMTVNTSGISINLPAYLTTAMASNESHYSATSQFSASFINTGQTGNFLTTAANSTHTHGAGSTASTAGVDL
jgi:hypothetical protein